MDDKIYECISLCWQTRATCQGTVFNYCLEQGGKHVDPKHLKLMTDCIQICQTTADFMTRSSELHGAVCLACAEICEACADSCEAMDDEEMEKCADICRECAAACRTVSN